MPPEVWKSLLGNVPNVHHRRVLAEQAIVGEKAWLETLNEAGLDPIGPKRVELLLKKHQLYIKTKQGRLGPIFFGGVFSPLCQVIFLPPTEFSHKKTRKRPVPVCFNPRRLKAEWQRYQEQTKRRIHQGNFTREKRPWWPLPMETAEQMGYPISLHQLPRVCRTKYHSEGPELGFTVWTGADEPKLPTFADAICHARRYLLEALLERRMKAEMAKDERDACARYYRDTPGDEYRIEIGDVEVTISRLLDQ